MGSTLPLLVSGASLFAQAIVPQEGPGIGSVERDRARTMRLLGRDSIRATVIPLGFSTGLPTSELRIVGNSNLPFTMNDGSLWAGRGFNMSVTPAGALTYRDTDVVVSLVLAPTITRLIRRSSGTAPGPSMGSVEKNRCARASRSSAESPSVRCWRMEAQTIR